MPSGTLESSARLILLWVMLICSPLDSPIQPKAQVREEVGRTLSSTLASECTNVCEMNEWIDTGLLCLLSGASLISVFSLYVSLHLFVAVFVGRSLQHYPSLSAPPYLTPPLSASSSDSPLESVKNRERHVIELGPSPWLQPWSN